MLREWLVIVVLAMVAAAGGAGVVVQLQKVDAIAREAVREPAIAPDFTVADIDDGAPLTLGQLRGKVVLLDLMASWCVACIEGMPALRAINDSYPADRFTIFSVGVDDSGDDPGRLRLFRDTYGGSWTFAYDADGVVSFLYEVSVLPTMLLLDVDGTVLWRGEGLASEALLRSLIDQALAG